ncbi:hypothetical protein ABW20_dc0110705 [Dactylellina cionopaga]|nr:hypothetical protein ABW20_dc0110705 [Dactylellina cionopaga]
MTIEVQITPPTIYSGSGSQPCGDGTVCYVANTGFTTGMCGTWLGQENYCCTVADLGAPGAPANNTCGSIAKIHDTNYTSFGNLSISAKTCPSSSTGVSFAVGDSDKQCCHYDDYYKIDQDVAAIYFYQQSALNLTTIRCVNLTTQGTAPDDSKSTYSGTKTGSSNGGSGGSGSGGSGSGGSGTGSGGSGSTKPNGVGMLTVPNSVFAGVLALMAVAAQLHL